MVAITIEPSEPVTLLGRFIQLMNDTWKKPADKSHMYGDFYEFAVVIVATNNTMQDDIAFWLLCELNSRMKFDNEDLEPDEIQPDWAKFDQDLFEYIDRSLA
jgi:hypothetical protein